MSPAHFGGDAVVARRRTHAFHLVGGDAHADAGAAYQDAAFHLTPADTRGYLIRIIGVVDALGTRRANILDLMSKLLEDGHQASLCVEPAMIAADGDFHIPLPPTLLRN